MRNHIKTLLATGLLSTVFSASLEEIEKRLNQLEEQNQQLIEEIAKLRQQVEIPELSQKQFAGMGYAASKVYFTPHGLSIGGYGEIIYQKFEGSTKKDMTDIYRFIPYIGYKFNDWIVLNAEVEFEHGADYSNNGSVKIEFAYLDFLFGQNFNIRLGNYLVPVGLTNLLHEPIFFNSVNRPEVEKYIIPTTWNENGVMVFSSREDWNYNLGVVNGFYYTGFSSRGWVRGGRQAGAKAYAEDWAVVGRLDYTGVEGLLAGVSAYHGNSGQGDGLDAAVSLFDIHLRYTYENWTITGLYAKGYLSDADRVSAYVGQPVGKEVYGYYINLAYDTIGFFSDNPDFSLPVFVRYERYNTQEKVPSGYTPDRQYDKTIWTVGINFRPHPNVVLKMDYQFRDNKAYNEPDVFELGAGFIF
ncbi:outer membrane beta-barrel protein [Persephonella sp.]